MTITTCQAFGAQNACYPTNNTADLDFRGLSPEVIDAAQNLSADELRDIQWLSGLPQTSQLDQATLEGFVNLLEDGSEAEEVEQVEVDKNELYRNNPTTIRAQKQLNKIYEDLMPPLELDGIRGPGTTARIRLFQEAAGLETTGKLDAPTRDALYNKGSVIETKTAEPISPQEREAVAVTPRQAAWVGTTDATIEEKSLLGRLVENIDTSHDSPLQFVTNAAAGLGDGISSNATKVDRAAFGGNESVDENSFVYQAAQVVGTGIQAGLIYVATGGAGTALTAARGANQVRQAVTTTVAANGLAAINDNIADSIEK